MYREYWKLTSRPFENHPDPTYLFESVEHHEALEKLMYAVTQRKGCALLTGEYGCGKTTLIHALVHRLNENGYEIALINNPAFTREEFLQETLYQFGCEDTEGSRLQLSRRLGDLFFGNIKKEKHNLVIVDEAQLISDQAVMEELRLLLNYQLEDRFLLTLLMSGQPELRERVREMPQLEQRISIKYHLHSFGLNETAKYVLHRLSVAGRTDPIFSEEAIRLIYSVTFGTPRRINNICDLALLEGCKRGMSLIDTDIINAVTGTG